MLSELIIAPNVTIKSALKALDRGAEQIAFVVNENKRLLGTLTDGDVRRAILNGADLERSIEGIYNTKPIVVKKSNFYAKEVLKLMHAHKIECIPLVDECGSLVDYVTWNKISSDVEVAPKFAEPIDVPVVIMAGGKGARLAPFTNVLPKPLVPVGEKTILELVIDRFYSFGVRTYLLTLNYKGEMIKAYLEGIERDYTVEYLWEKEFLGTAASILLAEASLPKTFIVSNCDILVTADYQDVLSFHKQQGAKITVLSSIQHHKIPYGVVNFGEGGTVAGIIEKPEYTFAINTGVYVLERECLAHIPKNTFFHMTHLIETVIAAGEKVATYPVNESNYVDIGQWDEYRRVVAAMRVE